MAKKWEAGVKYTFKDREGFMADSLYNTKVSHLLSDEFTPLELDNTDNYFTLVSTQYSDRIELPICILNSERKFFKRVR